MIVHRHRKCLLGDLLPDHVLIKSFPNLCRLRDPNIRRLTPGVFVELLIENAFANVDAAVANVNTWACDEFAHFSVALPTEGAHGEVRSARHNALDFRVTLSAITLLRALPPADHPEAISRRAI